MKTLLCLLTILFFKTATAQVTKVSLQASGLTCSMCSNSIYKSLKTINFIDKVEPNIKTSTFVVTFKPNTVVDFNKMKDKVADAGYAIAKFVAAVNFNNVQVKPNETVTIGNLKLRFLNVKDQALNGEKQIKIVSKDFVPAKEFKKTGLSGKLPADVYLATI
ncbi:MAG TPA: heavy-metal-associated domain-containing protein [Segetibacter sp.]|jgi:copper chaperone CopZ